jgi:hypothetical protein
VVEVVLLVYSYAATNTNAELDFSSGVHNFVSGREHLNKTSVALIIGFVPNQIRVSLSFSLGQHLILLDATRTLAYFLTGRSTSTPEVQNEVVFGASLAVSPSTITKHYPRIEGDWVAHTTGGALVNVILSL